ncbi:Uncharacterized protein DAT39_019784 [Clarias magur]|uniref:Uncharacterized protein n=1 Tax=Clarias magur TaxID=1594786 RepID=A0A8J4U4D3_CLAMG|nr:Uncharacterized protein DAT39_019784 [Clarias magur]
MLQRETETETDEPSFKDIIHGLLETYLIFIAVLAVIVFISVIPVNPIFPTIILILIIAKIGLLEKQSSDEREPEPDLENDMMTSLLGIYLIYFDFLAILAAIAIIIFLGIAPLIAIIAFIAGIVFLLRPPGHLGVFYGGGGCLLRISRESHSHVALQSADKRHGESGQDGRLQRDWIGLI